MKPNVAVLLYPGCIFFEIALAAETLAAHAKVAYYTPDGHPHLASNGSQILAAGSYSDLGVGSLAAVLVPGGDPQSILLPVNAAQHTLQAAANAGALIAGICAGNLVMAASGLLRGRSGTHNYTPDFASPEVVAAAAPLWQGSTYVRSNVVVDGRMITAMPWAYREYAATVARELGFLDQAESTALEQYPYSRRQSVEVGKPVT